LIAVSGIPGSGNLSIFLYLRFCPSLYKFATLLHLVSILLNPNIPNLYPTHIFKPILTDIPGKTTLAITVSARLNALHASLQGKTSAPAPATFVPMDGYHFSRAQLDAFPDPKVAHDRRGAAFTFDGEACVFQLIPCLIAIHAPSLLTISVANIQNKVLTLVQAIKTPLTPTTLPLYAPSFDHALKDPVYNDIPIHPTARIIIFEGNYLSLNTKPWSEAAKLMDELW
jgi:pantothenate kinase